MITLNSAFFHLGMSVRYRTVSLCFLREQEIKLLVRLMDPVIAKHVRVFCIATAPVSVPQVSDHEGHHRGNLWRKLRILTIRIFNTRKRAHNSTLDRLTQTLVDAASCWSTLSECSVTCWTPSQLLRAGFSAFGPTLQKLSLAATTDNVHALLSSTQLLVSLRELHIRFYECYTTPSVPNINAADVVTWADIIKGTSLTLETLSIHCRDVSTDFSQLFLNLGPFPRLQHFSLRAIFCAAFSTTPDGLTRFLHHQSRTLRSVGLHMITTGIPAAEESLSQWMTSAMLDPHILANLDVLEFYPTKLSNGFEASLALLQRSADTLTVLIVRYHYLTYGEVESIISTFSPHTRLQVLIMDVCNLSLQLLDLLARELPFLKSLCLQTVDYWPEGHRQVHEENMAVMRKELRTRTYPNWTLRELGIWINGVGIERDMVEMLARSIPSLRRFAARPVYW